MNIDTIFIECLKLPVFARVEYLEAEQAKSNFSKETYIKILYDKWKEYKSIVFKSDLEKPFDDLVKEKGWEYAAITVYGDEYEPFEHIYSNTEYDEIETEGLFNNLNQNNFEWLTENVLWVLLDYIYRLYDKWETTLIAKPLPPQQIETKTEQETPKTFEELFYRPEQAEPCLRILSELQPPVIDAVDNYIGNAKGVFPLWVKVLKNHRPEPLIKHFKDTVYKDLLNQKVKGLNLSKDASEFRKRYKRIENDRIELDIKAILSQYDQSGKLGK